VAVAYLDPIGPESFMAAVTGFSYRPTANNQTNGQKNSPD